jgi:hypothetical protein
MNKEIETENMESIREILISKMGRHEYRLYCGDRFRAVALPYTSAMAFVYVHVYCTVPAIKAVLCIEINLVLS